MHMERLAMRAIWLCTMVSCSEEIGRDTISNDRDDVGGVVDESPILDIGGTTDNGDAVFVRATDATRLSNGTIAIADAGGPAVVFFDRAGGLVRSVGRDGEGPGEFRIPAWVDKCGPGDSLFVWDVGVNRITVLDSTGSFVRVYRPPGSPSMMSCSPDGTFAIIQIPRNLARPDPSGQSPRYTGLLALADAEGNMTKSFGEVPVGENRPLGKVTRIALATDRLYLGTADSAFVDVYTIDGRIATTLQIGAEPHPATVKNYERAIDRMVAPFSDVDYRATMKEYLLNVPMPSYPPAYVDLFSDPDGVLWVVTSPPGDSITQLRAIGSDGRVLADVELPVEAQVFEVGRDYLLGTHETEVGDQHVVLYRLRQH